jgi:hypothetical protein
VSWTFAVPTPRVGEEIRPMPGLRVWRNRGNGFVVAEVHYTADPSKRGKWKYKASPAFGGLRSWRWLKEYEIDWGAQAGRLVFETYDETVHVVHPRLIPEHWPRWVLWDPGWSNPNSILWVAVDVDADPSPAGLLPIHVYREAYQAKRNSAECAKIMFDGSSDGEEPIEEIIVDPGARQEHQAAAKAGGEHVGPEAETVLSKFMAAVEELGWDVPVRTGANAKNEALLELVQRFGNWWCSHDGVALFDHRNTYRLPSESERLEGAYLVAPTIFVHRNCPNTVKEIRRYRWADWSAKETEARRNTPEKPVDKDDHSITNLIRFVNHLQGLRKGDGGADLTDFRSRFRRRAVKTADELAREAHAKAASRFGRTLRTRGHG